MKEFGGRLLTVLLWACVVVAVPLIGMRWVDSSIGMVAVLQSTGPLTGFVVAVLVATAAATRRWRATAAAGALLAVCATLAVPSVLRQTVAPGRLVHRPTGDVMLRAVHSLPPSPPVAAQWRSGLAGLQAWRERQPAHQPLVMAGDFNSSQDHPGFRRVAETMTDAHRAAGQGWVRTWPQGRRLIRPFVQLDHVLVRGLGVVDAGVVLLPDTDHAAVWARLSPRDP